MTTDLQLALLYFRNADLVLLKAHWYVFDAAIELYSEVGVPEDPSDYCLSLMNNVFLKKPHKQRPRDELRKNFKLCMCCDAQISLLFKHLTSSFRKLAGSYWNLLGYSVGDDL